MKLVQNLVFILALCSSLIIVFVGVLVGDFTWYTLGSSVILAMIIYSFVNSSDKYLILLVIVIFLYLRYIPIVKFNQPLFGDAVLDFKTAEVFRDGGVRIVTGRTVEIREWLTSRMRIYSGWPFIHLMAIALSDITGISLLGIFTYFPPLIALSSLLFVYLFANHIFHNPKIGGLAALMFATFPMTMHWQTLMVRANIGYSLALMAIYLHSKSKTNGERKILALALLLFVIVPIAHHLTSMDILYIFGFIFLLTFLMRLDFWRKISAKIHLKTTFETREPVSYLFTSTLLFVLGTSIFLYWIIYPKEIILRMFTARTASALMTLAGLREMQPDLPRYAQEVGYIDLYDILSFGRTLFLVATTLYGVFLLLKGRNRYKPLFYGLLIAPSILLVIQIFIDRLAEEKHGLFLLIGVFLLSAKVMHNFDKKILAVCLLILLVPTPFKLDTLLFETPVYIYDKSRPFEFPPGQKVQYRSSQVLAAASFFSQYANSSLKADFYTATALLFFCDPDRIYPLYTDKPEKCILAFHERYFDTHDRLKLPPDSEIVEYIVEYIPTRSNCIYSNGEVKGWEPYKPVPKVP